MTGHRPATPATPQRRYRTLLLVALAAGLGLTQCGGGSDQPAVDEGGASPTVPGDGGDGSDGGGGGDSAQPAGGGSRKGGGDQAAPTRVKLGPLFLVCQPAKTGGAGTATTATGTASCNVTNGAEVPVSGVTLELDGDLATRARPATGSCQRVGGRLRCNLGTLQPGQSVALLVEASPQAAGREARVRAAGVRRGGPREEGEAQMMLAR